MKKNKLFILTAFLSVFTIVSTVLVANKKFNIFRIDANEVNNNPCYLKEGYNELDYYLSNLDEEKLDIKTRATVTRVVNDGNYQYAFLQRTNEQTRNKASIYAYCLPSSPSLSFNDVIDIEASIYKDGNLPQITTTYTHFSKLDIKNPNEPIAREINKNNYSQLSYNNLSEYVYADNLFISSMSENVSSDSQAVYINAYIESVSVTLIINTMNSENTNAIANKIRSILGNTSKAINIKGNYFTKTNNNIEYRGICISDINDVTIVDHEHDEELGYYIQEDLSIVASDITYPSSTGNLKTLVVPINLTDYDAWTTSQLDNVDDIFFDDSENIIDGVIYSYPSFKEYYEEISYNQINFSGFVTSAFNASYTSSQVKNSWDILFEILIDAMLWAQDSYTDLSNHSEWDTNNDGYIDNIHFITNYHTTNDDWGLPLWPHMNQLECTKHPFYMSLNSYTINAINHLNDAYTTIHEQGHIFGLADYYDYTSGSQRDYVGRADMQSGNLFDWNSFSKLSVGWIKPYVVNGELEETTITINPASTTGDCIIIPANNSTWNGSAYDEYFLIELFNPDVGVNIYSKDTYNYKISSSGLSLDNAGIRLYHVDARLWDSYNQREIPDAATLNDGITNLSYVTIAPNNSYDASAYPSSCPADWSDFKLLTLIQSEGVDTFGAPTRYFLTDQDLFQTGDTFTFDFYKHFLTKKGNTVTTMDNGEEFPYVIYFENVSANEATIKITKVN